MTRAERIEEFVRALADEPCAYGDGCPTFGGTRHGMCLPCKATAALATESAPTAEGPWYACPGCDLRFKMRLPEGMVLMSAPSPGPSTGEGARCEAHSLDMDQCIRSAGHKGLHRYKDQSGVEYDMTGPLPSPSPSSEGQPTARCVCGHRLDDHGQQVTDHILRPGWLAPPNCRRLSCDCKRFQQMAPRPSGSSSGSGEVGT